MSIIQLLLIAVIITAALLAVKFLPGERSLAIKRLTALLFAACAIAAILFPQLLTTLAHTLGIGRGTDLLLYIFVIALLLFAVATIRAKARSDARVTELARKIALNEALNQENTKTAPPKKPGNTTA